MAVLAVEIDTTPDRAKLKLAVSDRDGHRYTAAWELSLQATNVGESAFLTNPSTQQASSQGLHQPTFMDSVTVQCFVHGEVLVMHPHVFRRYRISFHSFSPGLSLLQRRNDSMAQWKTNVPGEGSAAGASFSMEYNSNGNGMAPLCPDTPDIGLACVCAKYR